MVVTADNAAAAGFDTLEGAEAAALAYGDGSHVVDTEGQPYQPMAMTVEKGVLAFVGFGAFDARLGPDACLIEAAKKGYPPIVKAFLAKGADANAMDGNASPALIWAVAGGSAEVLGLLIEAGAGVNTADADGMTALGLARRRKARDLEEILLAAGAAE